ncbi:MAG TPA: condensation domain-containing protein, partial [Thermoanaerobaculia bacterium]|nr:condensation domain-containing protein [Thermoanaerobaculia bacterium]
MTTVAETLKRRLAEAHERKIAAAEGDRHAGLPTSFAQERLWLVDRLIPRPSAYHVARAFDLSPADGALDHPPFDHPPFDHRAFAAAVADLAARHQVLATTIEQRDGEVEGPVQRLRPELAPRPRYADLTGLPPAAAERATGELLAAATERPFHLAAEAPLRLLWVLRPGGAHTLLLVLHHVAADGWSLPILYRDLAALYRARREGVAAELPPLAVQYADFAAWQRQRLGGERLERLLDFWTGHLDGAPALLDLPTDAPRPARRSMRGARTTHR